MHELELLRILVQALQSNNRILEQDSNRQCEKMNFLVKYKV